MSHINKKKNIEGEYSYNDIAIAISKNASDLRNIVGQRGILQVYIPADFHVILQKARKIARREGRSLSDLVRDLLRDYVRVHEPGNPQLPLSRWTEGEKSQPKERGACSYCHERPARFKIITPRGWWALCEECASLKKFREYRRETLP